jgi:thiol:disulfide interchange protein DsbD
MLGLSAFLIFVGTSARTDAAWEPSIEAALAKAKQQPGVVLVDFYADWCAACKEYEHLTFSDPKVKAKLDTMHKARLDFTVLGEEQTALQEKYDIPGLPVLIFLRPDGTEIRELRIEQFEPPETFLPMLEKATSTQF